LFLAPAIFSSSDLFRSWSCFSAGDEGFLAQGGAVPLGGFLMTDVFFPSFSSSVVCQGRAVTPDTCPLRLPFPAVPFPCQPDFTRSRAIEPSLFRVLFFLLPHPPNSSTGFAGVSFSLPFPPPSFQLRNAVACSVTAPPSLSDLLFFFFFLSENLLGHRPLSLLFFMAR